MISKEGWQKARIGEYHAQRQALSRFCLAALLLSDPVIDVVRRELRRISPGIKISADDIQAVLMQEVIKREALEGEKAEITRKQVSRAASRALRAKANKTENGDDDVGNTDPEAVAADES